MQKIDVAQKELDFAKGSDGAGIADLWRDTGGGSERKGRRDYVLLGTEPGGRANFAQPFRARVLNWIDGVQPGVPTTYRIEVNTGPDVDAYHDEDRDVREREPERGSGAIKIPSGTQVLHGRNWCGRSSPAGQFRRRLPAAVPENMVTWGMSSRSAAAENLLKNPDFKETKDAAGKPEIAGWHGGISPANVSRETSQSAAVGKRVAIEFNNTMFARW